MAGSKKKSELGSPDFETPVEIVAPRTVPSHRPLPQFAPDEEDNNVLMRRTLDQLDRQQREELRQRNERRQRDEGINRAIAVTYLVGLIPMVTFVISMITENITMKGISSFFLSLAFLLLSYFNFSKDSKTSALIDLGLTIMYAVICISSF